MLEIWRYCFCCCCLGISVVILLAIIQFIYNIHAHISKREIMSYCHVKFALLLIIGAVLATGILISIATYFQKSWEHINKSPVIIQECNGATISIQWDAD